MISCTCSKGKSCSWNCLFTCHIISRLSLLIPTINRTAYLPAITCIALTVNKTPVCFFTLVLCPRAITNVLYILNSPHYDSSSESQSFPVLLMLCACEKCKQHWQAVVRFCLNCLYSVLIVILIIIIIIVILMITITIYSTE